MFKITFLNEKDFWLIPVNMLAICLLGVSIFAGNLPYRYMFGIGGFLIILMVTFFVNKTYNRKNAVIHFLSSLIICGLLTYGAYLLTN